MRAARLDAFDGHASVRVADDAPRPDIGPGDLRVRVRAAGVNFADTLQAKGEYQIKPPLPYTPGLELAGEVVEVGANVSGRAPGDAVMAMVPWGAFAEEARVPARNALAVPAGLDWAEAAAFPVAYGTSYMGLADVAGLTAGETLVVLGATGGVGLTAIETGQALGATVIGVAGGAEKCAVLRAKGVDHVIDHTAEDVGPRVKQITRGRGADVVYDPVGGDFRQTLKATAQGGRILVVGFASGTVPQIPANVVMVKNIQVLGFHFGAWLTLDPERIARAFAALAALAADGRIRPTVTRRYPLSETAQALADIAERRIVGKAVIEP
jgi:NADPH2:quinone reductase